MRLLLFNLVTDADDPILGFATQWIRALAQRVDFIHVVTMRAGRIDVPSNVSVHSVGKEKGYGEARRAVEFYRLLYRITRSGPIDACFSHMMPLFTLLAAPVLKPLRIPIVTWYAHPSATRVLKLAHRVSDRMVTSIETSYPYARDKLTLIGHGIDNQLFSPGGSVGEDSEKVILCVGRLSPVKDHLTLLRAAAVLRQSYPEPFRLVILGALGSDRDRAYLESLKDELRCLDLDGIVKFEPPTNITALPHWYRQCTVHVNLTPKGFVDKVALEAMSCAKPCLVANEGFRETLGCYAEPLLFRHRDPKHLAEKLLAVFMLGDRQRDDIGRYLSEQVARLHSLHSLSKRLVEILGKLKDRQSLVVPARAQYSIGPSRAKDLGADGFCSVAPAVGFGRCPHAGAGLRRRSAADSSRRMKVNRETKKSSPRVAWVQSQVAQRYSNARILDVGFMGRYAEPGLHLALRRKNTRAKVIGLDINVERVLQVGLPDTVVANADAIAARDDSFDVVLCLEMLEHLFSPMSVLREFRRVLRPGGDLVITTPNAWSWSNFFRYWMPGSLNSRAQKGVYRRYLGDADHKQFYDPLSLMSLLDYAGFDPTEVATKNHAIPFLRRYSNAFERMDLKFYPLNRLGHYICLIAQKRGSGNDRAAASCPRARQTAVVSPAARSAMHENDRSAALVPSEERL